MTVIDLNKSFEFFDPGSMLADMPVHVIGCGAIGSHVAEVLARLGVDNIHLYDDDKVASHNIANQMFKHSDIGKDKTECVAEMIKSINPGCEVYTHNRRVQAEPLKGVIFMCMDSIVPRRQIVEANQHNYKCVAIYDFRMGLTSGQFYCADTPARKDALLNTMNFTDEEADMNTPKSACNFELSVVYTIKCLVGIGMHIAVCSMKCESTNFTTVMDLDNVEHTITRI